MLASFQMGFHILADSSFGMCCFFSIEKNPGLFLQAAHEILREHPFARFTVVGDGPLRAPLEELAARLRISWAVHFAGWVASEQLPRVLAGIDIVVNPSLRAWSETFCISNIEVMSMGIPLVTFAVGGIGEYVQEPPPSSSQAQTLFSESGNAVVVHVASPTAVAQAVRHLLQGTGTGTGKGLGAEGARRALGLQGRDTVLAYFGVQRQMQQYADLYTRLHKKRLTA
jgi:glycosyltransferase involved in cell wall biosynthesis